MIMREHSPHDPFERRPGRGERGPRVFAPGDLKLLMLDLLARWSEWKKALLWSKWFALSTCWVLHLKT